MTSAYVSGANIAARLLQGGALLVGLVQALQHTLECEFLALLPLICIKLGDHFRSLFKVTSFKLGIKRLARHVGGDFVGDVFFLMDDAIERLLIHETDEVRLVKLIKVRELFWHSLSKRFESQLPGTVRLIYHVLNRFMLGKVSHVTLRHAIDFGKTCHRVLNIWQGILPISECPSFHLL